MQDTPTSPAPGTEQTAEQDQAPDAVETPGEISFDEASNVLVDTLRDVWVGFLERLPFIVLGVFILALTFLAAWIARRSVRKAMSRVSVRRSLKDLASRGASFTVWGAGLLLAAMIVFPDLSPGDALAALGIGSLAIGLAFRDIFENFFAGVLIL